MEDNAMLQQETNEGHNGPSALIVGHHIHHLPLLPRQVHDQVNVAPNVPQQESQEGQQGRSELVGSRLLTLPEELLQGWLNHYHNIRRGQSRLVGTQFLERNAEVLPRHPSIAIWRQCRPQQADYDRSCVLRVGNVRMLKDKARQGIGVCLTSPPFYIKGYRVCVRVYLNGDGIGGATHLSVFLVLMHGEFDTLLQWPFRQQVTVTLQDQLSDHDTLFLRVTLR
ncbi:uncharacterized protein LOC135343196 [Halichondria panicea]|uniref:uncharacterized protein LOC135343196 n=1 Tax=Halichondria panicea TaxID=6063 RepID=UPI00312B6FB8